jgi:hypothetical protein
MTATGGKTKRRDDGDARHDNGDPRSWGGGDCRATGAVNALDCGDGRGIAGVTTTTTTMGGPGNVNVEAVDRFARAGRL